MHRFFHLLLAGLLTLTLSSCDENTANPRAVTSVPDLESLVTTAITGANIFDGTGNEFITNGVLLLEGGKVISVGTEAQVSIPDGVERIDIEGRYIIPGLINSHGHVGTADGLETGPDTGSPDNIHRQLQLYAQYGITTVVSLGDDGEHTVDSSGEQDINGLERARLYTSGPVISPGSPAEAGDDVSRIAELDVKWLKIRVDDFLGAGQKMPLEVYSAVIEEAHRRSLAVAAHMVYLDDAKELLRQDVDLLAHSVRDQPIDDEFINLMRERDICLSPTLTREVSTFVYAERPDFFDEPFFRQKADRQVLAELESPERQEQIRQSRSAKYYRNALPTAMQNMARLANAGVRIAFGTDSGPPARFQGYFEHMEMEMMEEAGLTPLQILLSATRDAAECMRIDDEVGTLESGKWADFVVLDRNPLQDIRNTGHIHSVWVGGNRIHDVASR